MTKKHFEAIAALLNNQQCEGEQDTETVRSTAIRMAAYFSSENPRFDPKRFLTACGF